MSQTEQQNREFLISCGFTVALNGFPGTGGNWFHCSRDVDGVTADFSANLSTLELRRWGTTDSWSGKEIAAIWGKHVRAAVIPTATIPEPAADPDAAHFTELGFESLRLSDALEGLRRKYWAKRADGSAWLLDPNTGELICISDKPVSHYRAARVGGRWRLCGRDGQLRQERQPAFTNTPNDTPAQPARLKGVLFE